MTATSAVSKTAARDGARSLTVPVTVEFEDVDAYGIAHHLRLASFLERARLRLLLGCGGERLPRGVVPVMYDLHLRFLRPARLLDQLAVTAEIATVTRVKLALRYRIRRGEETLLRAESVVAFADAAAGGPVLVPDVLMESLGTGGAPPDGETA